MAFETSVPDTWSQSSNQIPGVKSSSGSGGKGSPTREREAAGAQQSALVSDHRSMTRIDLSVTAGPHLRRSQHVRKPAKHFITHTFLIPESSASERAEINGGK